MINRALFQYYTGLKSKDNSFPRGIAPTPESESYFFLEKGHVLEYVLIGAERKKVVSLFFGPGQFVIRSNLIYSVVVALDVIEMVSFTYSNVFRTLHNFPETKEHYREL